MSRKNSRSKSIIYSFFIFFLILCFSSQIFSEETQRLEFSPQESLRKAQELYLQLKKWQEEKAWDKFFSLRSSYLTQIEEFLKAVKEPLLLRFKAEYLLLKVKALLDLKGKRKAKEIFLKDLETIKVAKPQFLSFLKEVLSEIPKEDKKFKRKVSSLYVKLLKRCNSPEVLKKELELFYAQKDIDTFSKLAQNYLELIKEKKEFKKELKALIKNSICDGFKEICEPYLTEELFRRLSNIEALSEDWFYLRAYNLEKASEYEEAISVYKEFLKKFPDSLLSSEVFFRLAFLYMYKLKDFLQAKTYFMKLKDKGFDVTRYLNIIENKIAENELPYNEKMFLRALREEKASYLKGQLLIDAYPSRAFVNQKMDIKSISFSPDTGCLVPQGLYLWSGDLGEIKITTNTPSFSTSFKEEGFKIINLVELVSGNVILGFDSSLVNIYEVRIKKVKAKGDRIKLKAEFFPYLPESFLEFSWEIGKDGEVILEKKGKSISFKILYPSQYLVRVSLLFLGKEVYAQSFPL